ncbi:hypothetical protein FEV09_05005 [Pseudanabaena catenata USMAC16]|uniref:Uncharacterized protein n=1 Tax=Pseudanabaena catenata USMAC16 TaxID=1855837 RepID=A0A9X4M8U8_9CYAN|nr:hypothetical protein [Pseudanabaena catenata]MDG3493910.1 hypothetical protein [Pseudanabaena catenata USMAC16]
MLQQVITIQIGAVNQVRLSHITAQQLDNTALHNNMRWSSDIRMI